MASQEPEEPFVVDGMLVTAASELPPEVGDLSNYKPYREPVAMYRRFGPGRQEPAVEEQQDQAAWAETLRQQLSTKRRPGATARPVLDVRCEQGHPLLRILMSPWGLVPLSRTSVEAVEEEPSDESQPGPLNAGIAVQRRPRDEKKRRFVHQFHGEDIEPGRPRTLAEWPADRPMPPASCPCHGEVELSLADVKKWLASARRSVVYRPNGPIL